MSDFFEELTKGFQIIGNDFDNGIKGLVSHNTNPKIIKNNNITMKEDIKRNSIFSISLIKTKENILKDYSRIKYLIDNKKYKTLLSCNLLYVIPMITEFVATDICKFPILTIILLPITRNLPSIIYSNCKIYWIQNKLYNEFKNKIIVTNYRKIDRSKIEISIKSKVSMFEIEKNRNILEHILNSNIINIIQNPKRRNKMKIILNYGISIDYRNIKDLKERLTNILIDLKFKPCFIEQFETDIDNRYCYTIKGDYRKIVKMTESICHKLALSKGNLTIDQDMGKIIFMIRKTNIKTYIFDKVISNLNRPSNLVIPFLVGLNKLTGTPVIQDFTNIKHLLIAGVSGTGKSTTLHNIIQSLMVWNDNIFFYMLDGKGNLELSRYESFINTKVVKFDVMNDYLELTNTIDILNDEFKKRLDIFEIAKAKDIIEYNNISANKIPYIIFLIDEASCLSRLNTKDHKEIYNMVDKLTQLLLFQGRALGIYLVHTIQRPVEYKGGGYPATWRNNFTSRYCHSLFDIADSQKVLGDKTEAIKAQNQEKGEFILLDDNGKYSSFKACLIDSNNNKVYKQLIKDSNVIGENLKNGAISNVIDIKTSK